MSAGDKDRKFSVGARFAGWNMRGRELALLDQLSEQLRQIAWVYENEEGGAREGAKLACRAVSQFLLKAGVYDVGVAPLLAIMKGFEDLQKGIEPPIFSLDQSFSPKDRSSEREHHRQWVAAILHVLHERGEGLKFAAARIARLANHWSNFTNTNLSERTVIGWRRDFLDRGTAEKNAFIAFCTLIDKRSDATAFIDKVLRDGPPSIGHP